MFFTGAFNSAKTNTILRNEGAQSIDAAGT